MKLKFEKTPRIVKVTWQDIVGHSDWQSPDKTENENTASCITIGFIVFKNKYKTIICSEYSLDDPVEVGNRTVIPNCVIKKIEVIYDGEK